jgi:hypothetical protein
MRSEEYDRRQRRIKEWIRAKEKKRKAKFLESRRRMRECGIYWKVLKGRTE